MARFYIANKLSTAMLALTCLAPLFPPAVYGMDDNNEKKRKLPTVASNLPNKKRELPIKNKNVTTPPQKQIPIKSFNKTEEPPLKDVTELETIPLYIQEKMREREICNYIDQAEEYKNTSFSLLQTPKEHCSTLRGIIRLTEKSLIITTYQLNITRKFHPRLFRALEKASQRGVKIKLYYNHLPENEYQDYILGDLGNISNLECNKIGSHVKFVLSDEKVAAIGSFNWLSDYREEIEDDFGESYQNSTNVSLLIQGSLVKYLKEKYVSPL